MPRDPNKPPGLVSTLESAESLRRWAVRAFASGLITAKQADTYEKHARGAEGGSQKRHTRGELEEIRAALARMEELDRRAVERQEQHRRGQEALGDEGEVPLVPPGK